MLMKKRKQDPVELTLEEKLKNVRQAGIIMLQGRREIEGDVRLSDYGVSCGFCYSPAMMKRIDHVIIEEATPLRVEGWDKLCKKGDGGFPT